MAVDAPDDDGDRFDWDAASGTVRRNGVGLPKIDTDVCGAFATCEFLVAAHSWVRRP